MSPIPIPVPEQAEAGWRAELPGDAVRKIRVGPPPGVSGEECGTVEALAFAQDGMPVFCDYWRPTDEELSSLARGGFLELRQYVPQMVMHALLVWEADEPTQSIEGMAAQVVQLRTLRDQLALAADGLAQSPQQLGSIYALQYVVEQLNAILGAPEIPVEPEEPTDG